MLGKYYISAYATSPSFHTWNPDLEKEYFQEIGSNNNVIGIEHPFSLNSEKYSLEWLSKNIPSNWSIIITMLPSLMQASKEDPYFGIASMVENSREKALYLVEKINQFTEELEHTFKRNIVKAIHLHTSPKNINNELRGCKQSLQKSLNEIKKMKWGNIELNIEHCDALIPGQSSEKGFLSLEDEINVAHEVGGYGIVLNWGRSAIEARSAKGPLRHIKMAIQKNLLRGFFFSGCSDNPLSDYGQWKDTHMPPQKILDSEALRDDSLLGYTEIKESLSLLKQYSSQIYYGVKVLDPSSDNNLKKKISLNIDTLNAIEKVSLDI